MNLVFIFALDKYGYYCLLGNCKFIVFLNSNFIAVDSLSSYDNLYNFNGCLKLMKPYMLAPMI